LASQAKVVHRSASREGGRATTNEIGESPDAACLADAAEGSAGGIFDN
jgi:hypothetical protein